MNTQAEITNMKKYIKRVYLFIWKCILALHYRNAKGITS